MRIRAVVDNIEVGKALLLLDTEQTPLIWSQAKLPAEVREGDIVHIDVTVDKEETQRIKAENQRKLDELMRREWAGGEVDR